MSVRHRGWQGMAVLLAFLLAGAPAAPAPYPLPTQDPKQPGNIHQQLYEPSRNYSRRAKENRVAAPRPQGQAKKLMRQESVDENDMNAVPEQTQMRAQTRVPSQERTRDALPAPAAGAAGPAPPVTNSAPGSPGEEPAAISKPSPARRRLMVQLGSPPSAAQLQQLRDHGLRVEFVRENYVQGTAEDDALEGLSSLGFVRFIAPVAPAKALSEPAASGGLAAGSLLGLAGLHRQGATGKGVRVAVIDMGFDSRHPALRGRVAGTRSLRLDKDLSGAGRWRHGNAVAEVTAAVAPGAKLFLLNFDPDSVFGYLQAIEEATRDYHAQVVVLAVNFPTPYDFYNGRGLLARALDAHARKGVLFVAAAGNNARRHYAERFRDATGSGQHRFGAGEAWRFTVPAGRPAEVYLSWNDAWNDQIYRLGLYVFDERRQPVAYSNARQGQPVQFCTLEPADVNRTYSVVVSGRLTYRRDPQDPRSDLIPALGPRFHLFVYGDGIAEAQPAISEASLDPNFPTASGALTVGAVQAAAPGLLEPFSSRGRTSDGREKPDLVAPSGIRTAAMGEFAGTSAAAPFAAGVAALLLARRPGWSPAQVRDQLRRTARDLGPRGWDTGYGAGLIDPTAALL